MSNQITINEIVCLYVIHLSLFNFASRIQRKMIKCIMYIWHVTLLAGYEMTVFKQLTSIINFHYVPI